MTNGNVKQIYDLVIIGSGISGLAAARHATKAGKSCLVIDKGRRIGGRCSTKRSDGATFNHGAQFFTCKDSEFQALADAAETAGAAHKWAFGHHAPAFCGAPTMRDFPDFMAAQSALEIVQNTTITAIEKTSDKGTIIYRLDDSEQKSYQAYALIITAPAPQAARLVAPLDSILSRTALSASYDPCWTIMLALESPLDGAMVPVRDKGVIGWANYEPSRGHELYQPALTIQASPAASVEMLEWPAEEVIAHLRAAYERVSGHTLSVRFAKSHRWLYARVASPANPEMAFISADSTIALAGDYFGNARLESAFVSGRRAAMALLGK